MNLRYTVAPLALAAFAWAFAPPAPADWPWHPKASPSQPNDPEQIARSLDALESSLLTQGVVALKRPDVWGQDRMTLYRRDFDEQMKVVLEETIPGADGKPAGNPEYFNSVLSARVARSEQAAFSSQTALSGVLTSLPGEGRRRRTSASTNNVVVNAPVTTGEAIVGDPAQKKLGEAGSLQQRLLGVQTPGTEPTVGSATIFDGSQQSTDVGGEKAVGAVQGSAPFTEGGTTKDKKPEPFSASNKDAMAIGLEPTVVLDERKRWLDHLSELRRVNMGDDVSDMAGYGLYLFRAPASIQPGEATLRGHGALVTVRMRPEFGPGFLRDTFRRFVIADVLDQLAPVVYELVRNHTAYKYDAYLEAQKLRGQPDYKPEYDDWAPSQLWDALRQGGRLPGTRTGTRSYPIGPGEVPHVFISENLLAIARNVYRSLNTETPQESDVVAYLRHELGTAYDMYPQYEAFVPTVADLVAAREYSALNEKEYPRLVGALAGDLRGDTRRILPALCWAIAVDAGLLDRRLKEDMLATAGEHGFQPGDLDALPPSSPDPDSEDVFRRYVAARWPMVTFALDPVVDQQNIAEAVSQRRDLQLAVAYSLASGRISLTQAQQYSKRLEMDAETIALNRTVTTFAHGSDTFGWKFYPRYQTPPIEDSNLQTVANLVWRGGPGRNYGVKNSKLEPGQRELTVVVVMPSFLQRVKFEATGNWFPLHDPDHMKVHTARMVEQGRRMAELRDAYAWARQCGHYREGDLERLGARLDQVEAMLPMQTLTVDVPFETSSAGFQLFTPGSRSLAPELVGFRGVARVPEKGAVQVLLEARHLNIDETRVVVGGKPLKDEDVRIVSRDVIQITVPEGAARTNYLARNMADDPSKPKPTPEQAVEVFLASPNGVSNRLMIPAGNAPGKPKPPKSKSAAAATPAPASATAAATTSGFSFHSPKIPMRVGGGSPPPPSVRIELDDPRGLVPTSLRIRFLSPSAAGFLGDELPAPVAMEDGAATLSDADVRFVLGQIESAPKPIIDPKADELSLRAVVTPVGPQGPLAPVLTTNDLKITILR